MFLTFFDISNIPIGQMTNWHGAGMLSMQKKLISPWAAPKYPITAAFKHPCFQGVYAISISGALMAQLNY